MKLIKSAGYSKNRRKLKFPHKLAQLSPLTTVEDLSPGLKLAIERRNIDFKDGRLFLPNGKPITRENVEEAFDRAKLHEGEGRSDEDIRNKIKGLKNLFTNKLPSKASIDDIRAFLSKDSGVTSVKQAVAQLEATLLNRAEYRADLDLALINHLATKY